jgi:hypothetical protein
MNKYKIIIKIPTLIELEANSEVEAINKVKDGLVNSNQIKPCDPIDIIIIEEVK